MRDRPVSVTIFGILNIGYGVFGMAGVLLSSLLSGMLEGPGAAARGSQVNFISAFVSTLFHSPAYVLWNKITRPLDFAVFLLMVAAGAGLFLLKNWARRFSIGCAIYKILFAILNFAVFCRGVEQIAGRAIEAAGGAFVLIILGIIGLAATLLALVYPVLLLYFLTRPKVLQAFQPEPTA